MNSRITVSLTPDPSTLLVETPCPECKKKRGFKIPASDWEDGMTSLRKGSTMQTAFPLLDPDNRELLISGVCSPCWTRLFRD